MIWAIILAGGESKRMGKPKMLLPYGEKSIIETVIDNALQSQIDNTLVVLGAANIKISENIKNYPAKTTVNPNYRQGMLSSIQWGFNFLPEDATAAMILLGDQPSIPTFVIDKVIESHYKSAKGIILPACGSRRGHPILIDLKYKSDINHLSDEIGLRGLLYDHPDDIEEIEVDTPSIHNDIDTAEDYKRSLDLQKFNDSSL